MELFITTLLRFSDFFSCNKITNWTKINVESLVQMEAEK
jgi:hypothetical protein